MLYKLQENLDSSSDETEDVEPVGLDHQEDVVSMLGHYWHLITAADTSIRYIHQGDLGDQGEEREEREGASRRHYASLLGRAEGFINHYIIRPSNSLDSVHSPDLK